MKKRKKNDVAALLRYAGGHKGLTFLGLALSGIAMLLSMAPYICIWLAARDLIAVAPNWSEACDIAMYGWWLLPIHILRNGVWAGMPLR